MKTKKILFPIMLITAICLTSMGVVSMSQTMASPITNPVKSFSVYVDYLEVNNIVIVDKGESYISYMLELNENNKEYSLSFDAINNGDYDASLIETAHTELPEDLKGLLTYEIINNTNLKVGDMDYIQVKYTLKDNLTENEKNIIKKYKNIKINLMMNYKQA